MTLLALEPVEQDRQQLFAVLSLLDEATEWEIRADLAEELVRVSARYEDVKSRALYPALKDEFPDLQALDEVDRRQRAVRDAMRDVDGRTRHVKPINAHADDPEGFEDALERLIGSVRSALRLEESVVFDLVSQLGSDSTERLRSNLEAAVAHATSHPDPPRNPVARLVTVAVDKLDRKLEDASTTWHPGRQRLDEES